MLSEADLTLAGHASVMLRYLWVENWVPEPGQAAAEPTQPGPDMAIDRVLPVVLHGLMIALGLPELKSVNLRNALSVQGAACHVTPINLVVVHVKANTIRLHLLLGSEVLRQLSCNLLYPVLSHFTRLL